MIMSNQTAVPLYNIRPTTTTFERLLFTADNAGVRFWDAAIMEPHVQTVYPEEYAEYLEAVKEWDKLPSEVKDAPLAPYNGAYPAFEFMLAIGVIDELNLRNGEGSY